MAIDLNKARQFICGNGTLFERALFAFLFDGGSVERVHQIILCYKNPDNGFGHGFEHDLKAPQSNPLALEYLLSVMRNTQMPAGNLFDGTSDWVEGAMDDEGFLKNPPETRDYPLAPWWQETGGQNLPDAIVANLMHYKVAKPTLVEKVKQWAINNWTIEKVRANEWLFMAYHAHDFFFTIEAFPQLEAFQQATIENIVACAQKAPENQYYSLFSFATSPDAPVARALPDALLDRYLDYLASAQQDDGSWHDQHGLTQWYPMVTINVLLALKRFKRLEL